MALFGERESKEEKTARKVEALLKKYNLQDLSDPRDVESVKQISYKLMGNNLMELGSSLTIGSKSEDLVKMSYLGAIVEQNWIIIRMLDKLIRGQSDS